MDIKKLDIPPRSVLGLNYSGMHDSSIAIVAPDGEVLYALSLERVSRHKQDGRFPFQLLEDIPWDKISNVAVSNSEKYIVPENSQSKTHPVKLPKDIVADRSHSDEYYRLLKGIKKEKEFFSHHKAHASSSFYGSRFDDAICLVYDGGMFNEHWFGGIYGASKKEGIKTIDLFSTQSYSNITHLYTYITALLGFSPLRHEGKITGLAAYGKVTPELKELLTSWFHNPEKLIPLFQWEDIYATNTPPSIKINQTNLKKVQDELSQFSKEDLAATVQFLTEEHIMQILTNLKKLDIKQDNICLAGGLFANVKINQRVSEFGFKNIFIAPPMSDDGTALGAAWLSLSQKTKLKAEPFKNVYFGDGDSLKNFLNKNSSIKYDRYEKTEKFIAKKLSEGFVFAIFQGDSEFGPRALGNRSILAQATHYDINNGLNKRLSRTEFMPFAPVIRDVDCQKYFYLKEGEKFTAKFMTITVNCTKDAKLNCPAVVHVDQTARPQVIEKQDNVFIYEVLTNYANMTDKYALVNTSFNIHEEPIVNSYEDAIKGFFKAGLDYLYLDGIIISLKDNKGFYRFIKDKIGRYIAI